MSVRWLLALLLFFNLGLYFWLSDSGQQLPEVVSPKVESVGAISLLHELPASHVTSASAVVAESRCLIIGPLIDGSLRDKLVIGLSQIGIPSENWQTEQQRISGYWVYLPPAEDRVAAQKLLNEVYSKGVDSFVFEEGELANGVSFGLFSNQANASRRQLELARMGYQAKVKVAIGTLIQYWVQTSANFRSTLADKFWSDLKKMAPEAKISEKSCKAVASFRDIP